MKVKELIEKLKEFDDEKEVIAKFGLGENDDLGYGVIPFLVADILGTITIYCEYTATKEDCDFIGQIDLIEARNQMLQREEQ